MQAGTAERVLVSVATYNERDNVARLIDEIHQHVPHADVLIVDDNSPDGTGRLVDDLASRDPRIKPLHRAGKLGLGTAILTAMRYAIANDYTFMVNMDADFSHPPAAIPALLAGMRDRDVMIGSRYIPGGGTVNWPKSREAMSRTVNMFVRIALRSGVKDASGGFRCYRVAKLKQVPFDLMISKGYSFQQEMLFRCRRAGCRFGESPIVFENRRAGKSKVSLKESTRSIGVLLYLGARAMVGADRRRE